MRNYLIVDGNKGLKEYLKLYKKELKDYKESFKGWGYTFKEVKPKGAKRPYFYWYKWEYNNEQQNNVWTYIGKETPNINIPNPPKSRLDDIEFTIMGENILINETEYEKIKDLLLGYYKFEVQST